MKKAITVTKVEDYIRDVKNGSISLNVPVQRGDDQWSMQQKSKFIETLIMDYPVHAIHTVSYEGVQVVIDGLQRTTAIRGFYHDDYALEGVDEALCGKTFSKLDEEYKQKFQEREISLMCAGEVDYERLAQVFLRLNNGTGLSKVQKTRGVFGDLVAKWLHEMCEHLLFTKRATFTPRQLKEDAPLECLLQGILLINACLGDSEGKMYSWTNISRDAVQKYCVEILSKASKKELDSYCDVIKYLDTADIKDNYEKTFIPVLIVLAKYAIMSGVSNEDFNKYIEHMRINLPTGYSAFKGAGNVSKVKTIGRIKVIIDDFNEAFPKEEKPAINLDASRRRPAQKEAAMEKTADKAEDIKSGDNIRVEDRAEVEAAVDVLAEAMEMSVEADTSVASGANEEAVGDDSTQMGEVICQEKDLDMAEATVEAAEAGTSVPPETSGEAADDAPTQKDEGICQEGD